MYKNILKMAVYAFLSASVVQSVHPMMNGFRRIGGGTVLGGMSSIFGQVRYKWSGSLEEAYQHLGVSQSASSGEMKNAYKKQARKFHPDAPGGDHQKFIDLQDAYEACKNPIQFKQKAYQDVHTSRQYSRNQTQYGHSTVSDEPFPTLMVLGSLVLMFGTIFAVDKYYRNKRKNDPYQQYLKSRSG